MWVKFLKDYRFKPTPNTTTPYKAGMVGNLPKAAAEALVADGTAEAVTETGRPKKPLVK